MPTPDIILRPPTGLLVSQSILFVAPGTAVDQAGLTNITNRVGSLSQTLQNLRSRGLSAAVAAEGFPFDIDATLTALMDRPATVDIRPASFNELLQNVGLPGFTGQDLRVPPRTAVVFYLDPDLPRGTAESSVFRGTAILSTARSTVTVIRINADTPFGDHDEALPGIVEGLFLASEVRRRNYNSRTQNLAFQLSDALSERYRILPDDVDLPDFTSSLETDRIGFTQVLRDVNLGNRDGTPLTETTVLSKSRGETLGAPLLQLVWKNGRLELEIGTLTSREYAAPELVAARRIFLETIRQSAPGTSLHDIIQVYDARVVRELGATTSRYQLLANEGADLRSIVVNGGNARASYADITPSVMFRYKDIDSAAFREGLGTEAMRNAYDQAVRVGGQLFSEMRRYIASTHFTRLPIVFSEELRAFFIHVLFTEFQIQAAGPNPTREQLDVIFHASPADAVFSILSRNEAHAVGTWFNNGAIQQVVSRRLQDNGIPARPGTDSWKRIREAFFVAPRERAETEHAQLWIDPDGEWSASPVPDGHGRLVYHYGPGARDRRPLVVDDGVYHIQASFTSEHGTFSHLWNAFEDATPNAATRLLQELVPDTTLASPYARSVRELEEAAAPILSYDVIQDGPAGLMVLINEFVSKIPEKPAFQDGQGRVAEGDVGWWVRARRLGLQVRSKARSINENGLAQELSERFRNGFLLDIDQPRPKVNQVRFENGQFHTWRGEISIAELGLPEGWHPGDAIGGYRTSLAAYGFYEYTALDGDGQLPAHFSMSWNGLAWPTAPHVAMGTLQPIPTTTIPFLDRRGDQPVVRQIELPSFVRRLPGTQSHKFLFRVGGLDGVLVLLDAYDFVPPGAGIPTARAAFERLRRELVLFAGTEVGQETARRIATLPRLSSTRIDPTARLDGASYSEILGDLEATAILELRTDSLRLNLLTPQGGRRLALNLGDTTGSLTRDLISLGYGIESYQPTDGSNIRSARLRRLYELHNRVNAELGIPLHFRAEESETHPLVPLDGSVVLRDENDQPITTVQAWEETQANRYIEAFMERARRIYPEIRALRASDPHLGKQVALRMRQILDRLGNDPALLPVVEELHMIKRQLMEGAVRIRQARDAIRRDRSVGFAPEEPFQLVPETPLLSGADLLENARSTWEAWERRRYRALGSGELTDDARAFLVREVALTSSGVREYAELQLLYDGLSEVQQNFMLSNMVVVLDRAVKANSAFNGAISHFLGRNFNDLKRVQDEIRDARNEERMREILNHGHRRSGSGLADAPGGPQARHSRRQSTGPFLPRGSGRQAGGADSPLVGPGAHRCRDRNGSRRSWG